MIPNNSIRLITAELLQLFRDRTFLGLMLLLLVLMALATWNADGHVTEKREQNLVQQDIVYRADVELMAQIDSLHNGLATYEKSYTLPTSGVRLTYNNHRLARLPFKAFSLIAIGQGDLYGNYKKIVLYFKDSYEMNSKELVSPIEQLFGQLDLSFVWVFLLPLIIILVSFNILSLERETGRLPLIAAQPIKIWQWLLMKIGIRFLTICGLLLLFTFALLTVFGIPVWEHISLFGQLILVLVFYMAFWFFFGFAVNLAGYSSGKSLIILTGIWVLFVFLIPSIVNQLGKELHPIPSRLALVNNHQAAYNAIESDLDKEMEALYRLHPDWYSEDPVTKDMSNSTGWNINYLAKQYIAQLKHQPVAEAYEAQVDLKNEWSGGLRVLSPAMIVQRALAHMAGTSTQYYRSFLKQAQEYANTYRQYVFKRLFTNHAFTVDEIKNLSKFKFDEQRVSGTFANDLLALLLYLCALAIFMLVMIQKRIKIK